jgi:hypothetical protein
MNRRQLKIEVAERDLFDILANWRAKHRLTPSEMSYLLVQYLFRHVSQLVRHDDKKTGKIGPRAG